MRVREIIFPVSGNIFFAKKFNEDGYPDFPVKIWNL